MKKNAFFAKMELQGLALSYDDIRLRTGFSEVDPKVVDLRSRFSRNVPLNIPVVSAVMDTVTESKMAIAMAKMGGLGIIHKGLSAEDQAYEVKRVKLHLNGKIDKPITALASETITEIMNRRESKGYNFSSFPVLDVSGKLIGLLTRHDLDLNLDDSLPVEKVMTPLSDLVIAGSETTLEEAKDRMRKARKKILPLVGPNGELCGLYVFTDVKRLLLGSSQVFNVDHDGHLRVGAGIGAHPSELDRAQLLVEAGCDVLVVDTAHGDSKNVFIMVAELKKTFGNVDVVAGNISEPESAKRLADAGVDGIKIGQGPGSICTTRIVAGIGCPQATAVYECANAIRGSGIPVCADGGIKNSGDIPIAIGLGGDSVMLGRMLAGCDEAPGEIRETTRGRMKVYRGMGSLAAMRENKASRERYKQSDNITKLVPEGVESVVPYDGSVNDVVFKLVGGLRSGMGYVGASTIPELQEKADFRLMSSAGLAESHPHDVTIIDNSSSRK